MTTFRTVGAVVSVAMLAALAAPAQAKHPVSSKFDGTYTGEAKVAEHLSTGTCAALGASEVTVAKGFLKGTAKSGPRISGLVVSSGFVTGSYRTKAVHAKAQGLIDDGHMVLGLQSADGKCFWLMELTRK